MSPAEDVTTPRAVDAPALLVPSTAPPADSAESSDVLVPAASFGARPQPEKSVASARTVIELLIVRYVIATGNQMLSILSEGDCSRLPIRNQGEAATYECHG